MAHRLVRSIAPFRGIAAAGLFLRRAPAMVPAERRTVAARASAGKTRTIKIAQILVNKDQATLLDDIEAQIKGGAAFDVLALQHSVCQSAKRGGEVGWLSPGTYFPEVEAAAAAVGVNGMARATTARGHHLVMVMAERYQSGVQQMSAEELQGRLAEPELLAAEEVQMVDVREAWEHETARIPGFKLMPLSQFQEWGPRVGSLLDPSKETLVLCHHGVRSMQAASFLAAQGFDDVKNISGGIDAYSRLDPSVPFY